MTIWHWVRHGPTHAKNFVGWRDLPADLSDTALVGRVSDALPDAPVVSSDLLRATQTADAIAGGRPRLGSMPGLREFNFGAWDGQHFKTIADRHPNLSRAYWETPGTLAPPGGESWNAAAERVETAVRHLNRLGLPEIIAVAHIGVILTQVQKGLGCSAYEALGHKIDNLSITTINHETGEVSRINHCP